MRLPGSCALLGLAIALYPASGAQGVDVYDVDQVVVGWDAAAGPVAGYFVYVARNGQSAEVADVTAGLQTTIPGSVGDEIQVVAIAYDAAGQTGPLSPPSPVIRFAGATPAPPDDPPPPDDTPDDPPPSEDPTPPVAAHTDLDFNGDGTSDLLLRDSEGELSIWYMDGSVATSRLPVSSLPAEWSVVGNGDYDGNQDADVAWQETGTGRVVVELLSDGNVIQVLDAGPPEGIPSDEWLVGGSEDFDGDGRDELLFFSRVLGESQMVHIDLTGVSERVGLPGYGSDFGVDEVGDLDGDGLAEVLWRDDRSDDLIVWDLDGAGAGAPSFLANSAQGWRTVGSGDFDGNGTHDLFVVRREPDAVEVWLLESNAVAGVVNLPVPPGPEWTALSVGDHDRDGLSDLTWRHGQTGDVEIWFSNGDSVTPVGVTTLDQAASQTLVSGTQGTEDARYRESLCNGDFNGDGVVGGPDLAVMSRCVGKKALGSCEVADMDSDGEVTELDMDRFRLVFGRATCVQ